MLTQTLSLFDADDYKVSVPTFADRLADVRETVFTLYKESTRGSDVVIRRAIENAAAVACQSAARHYVPDVPVASLPIRKSDDMYRSTDMRMLGTFSVADYCTAVDRGEILRSFCTYFAAWLSPTGDVLAVTRHEALTDLARGGWETYSANYNAGRVRLEIADAYPDGPRSAVQIGTGGITSAQIDAVAALADRFDIVRQSVRVDGSYDSWTDHQWPNERGQAIDAMRARLADAPTVPVAKAPTVPVAAPVVAAAPKPVPPIARPYARPYVPRRRAAVYFPRHIRPRPNKYAADCTLCGQEVAAGAGTLTRSRGSWVVTCLRCEAGR